VSLTDRLSGLSPEQRAQVALRLRRTKRKHPFAESEPLPEIHPDPQNRYDPFPLSDIQEAYLIGRSNNVELGNISCQTYSEVDVSDWDHQRLESALQAMIERHEMLRSIVLPDGRQQILKDVPRYQIQLKDLRGLEPAHAAAQLEAVRRQMSQLRPTDRWPLFDFRVSRLDSRRSRLHVSFDLLIADARSLELFFAELAHLYHNPAAILSPLEVSFRDYLLAFNCFEKTGLYRESREYWLKRLPTLPPAPELPLATNTSLITRPQFKRRQIRVDASVWQSLKKRSARLSLTPAGILLAAYAEVIAIWSKNPRFTINLTLFNRLPLHKQVNDIIGDFTSVTLLEVDSSGSTAFEAFAKRLQEQLWQDLDYRHFSGVRVMRELTRSQGGGPRAIMPVVFTSLLNLGDGNEGTLGAGRLGQTVYGISQTPQLYLDCIAHEEGQELVINWDAVEEVFPPGLLDDMFQSYRSLLAHLASDNSSWYRSLAETARTLIPATQIRLREEINDTQKPLSDELLHTLFLKQVEERPHQTAVCTPQRRLTYADVYRRACGIEELLVRRDVEPNQLVAVVMEKGWEQIVAVLGILFAGGAYLPISPELPAERQRYLIERGKVKVVLTQSSVEPRLSVPTGVEVLAVDLLKSGDPGVPVPRRRQKPEDLAYVIFTSGSTGLPKGVMIDHRGAVNTVLDINQRFGIGCQDRVLALSQLSFDLSVYDIFGLLAAGGTIVLPSFDLALDAAHWAHLVESEKVTVWNTVPTLMQLLVEEAERGGAIGQSLRLIMMSGDWIPTRLPGRIRSLRPQAKIVSLGGATEASIWSILYPIEQIDPNWTSIPYGKPMLNQSFHVLTETLAPRPDWVPGQLYIGGIGLAKGYWRDEEKTNASFIWDPATGQRLYRTGDLGRYLPDGNIEFLGREDFQIKLRGYRIELGEIEAILSLHPAIYQCAAIAREDPSGDKQIVAYFEVQPGEVPNVSDLRAHLEKDLPTYMIPSVFVPMEKLPLTPNGKIDRKALPIPTYEHTQPAHAFVRPQTETEKALALIWTKLLKVDDIGIKDDFFRLGGHSLLAIRLLAKIEEAFGRRLPIAALLQTPTIERLAAVLSAEDTDQRLAYAIPIQPAGEEPPFFCVGAGPLVRPLCDALGNSRPFYSIGLKPAAVERFPQPYRAEEVGKHLAAVMREAQPNGPYYLGGFCADGIFAYETARQLTLDGCEVGLLVLFETSNPNPPRKTCLATGLKRLAIRLGYRVSQISRVKLRELPGYVRGRAEEVKSFLQRLAWNFSRINGSREPQASELNLERLLYIAATSYKPQPITCSTSLFRGKDWPIASAGDPYLGWREMLLGPTETHEVPGDHSGIFAETNVEVMARLLKACLLRGPASQARQSSVLSQKFVAPETILFQR
jgi:pyochelin synthetase